VDRGCSLASLINDALSAWIAQHSDSPVQRQGKGDRRPTGR
jgi:hypothetical protein